MTKLLRPEGCICYLTDSEASNLQPPSNDRRAAVISNPSEVYFPPLRHSQLRAESLPIAHLQNAKLAIRLTYLQLNHGPV
ncbi:MAG: hypothetical protein ACRC8A_02075 [Microcoleaceae cyanobacterium]